MNHKILGWIQLTGGILALLFSGQLGYSGMQTMMGFGTFNMNTGTGLAVLILSLLALSSGIYHITEYKHHITEYKHSKR